MAEARFVVDSTEAAAEVLLTVLNYARENKDDFVFGPMTAGDVVARGMKLSGDIDGVAELVEAVPGAEMLNT